MDWKQILTILWLRWRLTRNQWSRSGGLNAVITMIFVVAGLAIGIAGGVGGILAGTFAMSKASPKVILVVWDAIICLFLFFWMIGILTEIQRSETIDISRMLHLPISLKKIFVINYIASHLTLSIIVFLPGMLGLSLGLIFGRAWAMIWMFPLVLTFIFMVTAWTYCLRGWLVTLMVNKRRRRAVIAVITFTFIIVAQLPNIFVNVLNGHHRHVPANTTESTQSEQQPADHSRSNDKNALVHAVLVAHNYVPFLWTSKGAMSLAMGNVWPAVLGAAGMFLIGGCGLMRASRTTFRFYHGQTTGNNISRRSKVEKPIAVRRNPLEGRLPYVPEEAAVLAMTFFRSLVRAPEVMIAMMTNIIILLIFGSMIFFQHSASLGDKFKPFIATGAVTFMFLGMSQLMFNQFGFDRNGFRKLVLLPVPRKYILLGKNLAILPIVVGIGLIFLLLVKILLSISLAVTIATSFQLVSAFFLLSMLGNLSSVLVPYRIAPGSLKSTKSSATTTFLIFLSHLLIPIAMTPIFLPPALGLLLPSMAWLPSARLNYFLSVLMLGLTALFYRLSLASLGNLLQRREKKILQVVTQEVE